MGRPRKVLAKRKPCGRIYKTVEGVEDPREVVAQQRVKHMGVTAKQSQSPLAGYMVGILFLRRKLELIHVAHYYSYLQSAPRGAGAIAPKEKVHTSINKTGFPVSPTRLKILKWLKPSEIKILDSVILERLTCSVDELKRILEKVPLSNGALWFMHECQNLTTRKPR